MATPEQKGDYLNEEEYCRGYDDAQTGRPYNWRGSWAYRDGWNHYLESAREEAEQVRVDVP